MSEENNTDTDATAAKAVADALAAQTAKFEELLKAGNANVDEAVLRDAKAARDAAEKAAHDMFKARDEAKRGAQTADQQIAEMRAKLRASEVKAAAAEAGAINAKTLVSLVGPDDDVAKRISELKESDPYLFGSTTGTGNTGGSGGSGGGLDLGQTNGGNRPDPVGEDEGLKAFATEIEQMVGIKRT